MASKIQKWGNSLALRIPKSYAEALELNEGASVKIKIVKNKLVVSRKKKQDMKLNDLLSGITDKNLHKEIIYFKPSAKEINQ
ncbi:MAG: AbrB/MazE/SpoVT family DNA-binding domain-containing protein [Ignavibacteriae bacterium]|nr:AbrB/MazE/SpoVT family DNA-binding domain-containing protein [Ignavibacteriota bacterium]